MENEEELDFYVNIDEVPDDVEEPSSRGIQPLSLADINALADAQVEVEPERVSFKVDSSTFTTDTSDEVTDEKDDSPRGVSFKLDINPEELLDNDDNVISPEENLKILADKIMACCIKPEGKEYLEYLVQQTNPVLFRDENHIIFRVYCWYRGKLKRISIGEEFLKIFLTTNQGIFNDSKNYIDIYAYGEVDGSNELGYLSGVIKHFNRLRSMEVNPDEFYTLYEEYLLLYASIESKRVYAQGQQILTDGLKVRGKRLFGFKDSETYVKRKLAEIESLLDKQNGTGFQTLRELLREDDVESYNKSYKISDFGRIEALNKIYGGIYTKMFYSVLAGPKMGKSKWMARLVHQAAIVNGQNVTVWAQEGGKEAFSAQLRAIHFDYMYNTGKSITEKRFGVDQSTILQDSFANDELRALENSSKIDLMENPSYGSIDFIDRPFEVETFLDDIDTSIKSNRSVMLVIDYLQLILSGTGKGETERVTTAYTSLLAYIKKANIACFSPAQYKQEAFDKLTETGDLGSIDLRTAGGKSGEVTKTPDIILSFWASKQDLENNRLQIISVPSRFGRLFPNIHLAIDFETCQFISVDQPA